MTNTINRHTFLFYDYETFGKNPALDRPVQFASIRTNNQFEILGSPEVFFCRPPSDYLPDPEAVLITGITPQQALHIGVIEAEFARRIHQIFSTPRTCILGYNNICFDDEVSRYLFYRNFYDPYGWSWKKGNTRLDLLNVVRACYALRPDGIEWPLNDQGLPSFRLEHLTYANGIRHTGAHDAMADVYAILSVAQLIRKAQPRLFDYLYCHSRKHQLKKLVDVVTMKPLVYVSSVFGAVRGNIAWVAPLAWHSKYLDTLIVCDLSSNVRSLEELDSDIFQDKLYMRYETLKDDIAISLKLVRLNKCPALMPGNTLRPKDAERLGIHQKYCLDNLIWLRSHPTLKEKIAAFFSEKMSMNRSSNVDKQLYDRFFNDIDRMVMNTIHATSPEDLSKLDVSFADFRLKPLLFRYRARNFPHTLNDDERCQWLNHCQEQFTQVHLRDYVKKIETLCHVYKNEEKKKQILLDLLIYLKTF